MNRKELDIMFFNLLEGELSTKEKEEALKRINSDAELKKEWMLWQMTTLEDDEDPIIDTAPLLAITETKRTIIFPWRTVIAACLLIGVGFVFWFALSFLENKTIKQARQISVDSNAEQENALPIKRAPSLKKDTNFNANSTTKFQEKTATKRILVPQKRDPQPLKKTDSSLNLSAIPIASNQKTINKKDSISEVKTIPDKMISVVNKPEIKTSYATVTKKTLLGSARKWLGKKRNEVKKAVSKPEIAFKRKEKKVIINNKKYALTIKR
jgi:hypothetical protein